MNTNIKALSSARWATPHATSRGGRPRAQHRRPTQAPRTRYGDRPPAPPAASQSNRPLHRPSHLSKMTDTTIYRPKTSRTRPANEHHTALPTPARDTAKSACLVYETADRAQQVPVRFLYDTDENWLDLSGAARVVCTNSSTSIVSTAQTQPVTSNPQRGTKVWRKYKWYNTFLFLNRNRYSGNFKT